ncbi:MAG TPA: hypothetical protein VLH39_04295 [Magnetospirillaceae bacterium]|nr:hypothetical protein [Magnetospirillaceae bacterium]
MSRADDEDRGIQSLSRAELVEEVRSLRLLLEGTRDLPMMAGDALRRAHARIEEYRTAFGVAADELSLTRARLADAWRELKDLEYCTSPAEPAGVSGGLQAPPANEPGPRPDAGERGACPSCGERGSHAVDCSLARVLDARRDPRPLRRDIEYAVDCSWAKRSGERDGVRARLLFLDVLFEELARWGAVRDE